MGGRPANRGRRRATVWLWCGWWVSTEQSSGRPPAGSTSPPASRLSPPNRDSPTKRGSLVVDGRRRAATASAITTFGRRAGLAGATCTHEKPPRTIRRLPRSASRHDQRRRPRDSRPQDPGQPSPLPSAPGRRGLRASQMYLAWACNSHYGYIAKFRTCQRPCHGDFLKMCTKDGRRRGSGSHGGRGSRTAQSPFSSSFPAELQHAPSRRTFHGAEANSLPAPFRRG